MTYLNFHHGHSPQIAIVSIQHPSSIRLLGLLTISSAMSFSEATTTCKLCWSKGKALSRGNRRNRALKKHPTFWEPQIGELIQQKRRCWTVWYSLTVSYLDTQHWYFWGESLQEPSHFKPPKILLHAVIKVEFCLIVSVDFGGMVALFSDLLG